jgi:hypothetical protein
MATISYDQSTPVLNYYVGAWAAVVRTLNDVAPGWNLSPDSAIDAAVASIRRIAHMAAQQQPTNAEGPLHAAPEPAPGLEFDERGVLGPKPELPKTVGWGVPWGIREATEAECRAFLQRWAADRPNYPADTIIERGNLPPLAPDEPNQPDPCLAVIRTALAQVEFPGYEFICRESAGRFYIQARFRAPHCQTGEVEVQHTRKWYVSKFATRSEIVQTALKLVLTSVEHEAREQFKYKGRAVFGPHLAVDQLWGIAGHLDRREQEGAKA